MSHSNLTLIANGGLANKTSESAIADLFAFIGAARNDKTKFLALFKAAYEANPLWAKRILFYTRDVRGGQGEREAFRHVITSFDFSKEDIDNLIPLIAEYGRWDDVVQVAVYGKEYAAKKAAEVISAQLQSDMEKDAPSLMGKWLPSENASSKTTKAEAKKIRAYLSLGSKTYRETLTALRKKIAIVEAKMSAKDFGEIDYERVPSLAMKKYRSAFGKQDAVRFGQFIENVKKGTATIKASTLYPYELVRNVINHKYDDVTELQWKALPDFLKGNEHNGIVMCDCSGSMTWGSWNPSPQTVALSLTVYIAERNKGAFHNTFMTFSDTPTVYDITDGNLKDKVFSILDNHNHGTTTNVNAAFDAVLNAAKAKGAKQEELPSVIYVVSDMEFNTGNVRYERNLDTWKRRFSEAGYSLPKIVFWNVAAVPTNSPTTVFDENTILVSGCNPNIFRSVLSSSGTMEMIREQVIDNPRYAAIV